MNAELKEPKLLSLPIMSKIGVVLFCLLLIGCQTVSQKNISIDHLKESYSSKDEAEFMRQFPSEMRVFKSYFGWNDSLNKPEELYEESYQYIDYWFTLLDNEKFVKDEVKIIQICDGGKWEADAVNYFQNKSLKYIKEKNKFDLINKLDDTQAKSVLFFLFDSPHPSVDAAFKENLTVSKQEIVQELQRTSFNHHGHENEKLSWKNYVNNDAYFISEIDVNDDGLMDKVFSNRPYEGDELLIFLNQNGSFELELRSTNFSEDGGCQIEEILPQEGASGMIVSLVFRDGGLLEEDHFISLKNGRWELSHTVYRTESSNQQDAGVYVCNVNQQLDMTDPDLLNKLKLLPSEEKRDKKCEFLAK